MRTAGSSTLPRSMACSNSMNSPVAAAAVNLLGIGGSEPHRGAWQRPGGCGAPCVWEGPICVIGVVGTLALPALQRWSEKVRLVAGRPM